MQRMISKIALILTLGSLSACSTALPELDHPITLYKGCPEVEGICKKAKAETKAEAIAALNSIPPAAVSDWVEKNINGVNVRALPAKSPEFKKYIAMSADDLGTILKFINELKARIMGN